jgi:hypothetical protein
VVDQRAGRLPDAADADDDVGVQCGDPHARG